MADEISERILREFDHETALPSERELSARYCCNHLTIRRALKKMNESGLLTSIPRVGHLLNPRASNLSDNKKSSISRQNQPHILILFAAGSMKDSAVGHFIGGLIHYASFLGASVTIKELPKNVTSNLFESYVCVNSEIRIDGYILCGGVPFALYDFLANSMRPCIMVGYFEEQLLDQDYKLRCLQFFMSLEEPYAEVGKKLIALGHRKVMMASMFCDKEVEKIKHILERQFVAAGLSQNCIDAKSVKKGIIPYVTHDFARQAAREIAGQVTDHTAVLIIDGNIFGQTLLYVLLTERELRCPEDISIVAGGAESDWYQELYNVDRIYFEYGELGGACIKEVMRQIENGRLGFGSRYLPGSYLAGKSVGPVKRSITK
jgi:DNA-binding transcriptional regulator YhcF (GntR family)